MNSQIEQFAGFQMFCLLEIAKSPGATGRKRTQARRNFLSLVQKHPEVAKRHGFIPGSLIEAERELQNGQKDRK